jgi:formate hydrogenlyase transcriptional activator
MGKRIDQIVRRTQEAMQQYSWPGNIRELQNVIERGVILADTGVFRLDPGTLPASVTSDARGSQSPNGGDQRTRIEAVLRETHGRISGPDGAAVRLGIPASTLESRIRALKINKHEFRAKPS